MDDERILQVDGDANQDEVIGANLPAVHSNVLQVYYDKDNKTWRIVFAETYGRGAVARAVLLLPDKVFANLSTVRTSILGAVAEHDAEGGGNGKLN